VVSLAILADEEPGWEPDTYEHELYGTQVGLRYRTVKLWEYNSRWAELKKDPNPFALVVMAHLKTKATRGDAEKRLVWKVKLVQELYKRGYNHEEIHDLFRFIDWLLALPDDMTQSFRERIEDIEQESKMKYVTSIERLGRQEGHKEGLQEGIRVVVLRQLEAKFGSLDASILQRIEKASREQILLWAERILTASSPDEIFAT
jgi:flagellar biosynthesis/type III secretory pathway protein FliH